MLKLDSPITQDQEVVGGRVVKSSVMETEAVGQMLKVDAPSTQDHDVVGSVCEAAMTSVAVLNAGVHAVKVVASCAKVRKVVAMMSEVTGTISLLLGANELVSSVREKNKQERSHMQH